MEPQLAAPQHRAETLAAVRHRTALDFRSLQQFLCRSTVQAALKPLSIPSRLILLGACPGCAAQPRPTGGVVWGSR